MMGGDTTCTCTVHAKFCSHLASNLLSPAHIQSGICWEKGQPSLAEQCNSPQPTNPVDCDVYVVIVTKPFSAAS